MPHKFYHWLKYLIYILLFVFLATSVHAQEDTGREAQVRVSGDSLATAFSTDSAGASVDTTVAGTVLLPAQKDVYRGMDSQYRKWLDNPFLRMKKPPVYLIISERQREDKDAMFYLFAGLLLFLSFIKVVFPRYFANVFRLFFQPSFRQKQTREQLAQAALPSLLLNLFFVFSGGAYMALLISFYNVLDVSFWLLFLNSSLLLLILYVGKYLFMTFAGWVFQIKQAADTYAFVVLLINKILGVLLLPFILVIAFSRQQIIPYAITISLLLIGLLFVYRYFISLGTVRREVKASVFHFLFYVCAFEVIPLLLIYKTLIIYLDKSL